MEGGGVDVIVFVGGCRRMCITLRGRSTEFDSCWGEG